VCFLCLDGSHESSLLLIVDRLSRPGPAPWLRFVSSSRQGKIVAQLGLCPRSGKVYFAGDVRNHSLGAGSGSPERITGAHVRKEPVD